VLKRAPDLRKRRLGAFCVVWLQTGQTGPSRLIAGKGRGSLFYAGGYA